MSIALTMCLVKTLLAKTLWEKSIVKEKEYIIVITLKYAYWTTASLKTLLRKIQWEKS